MVKPLSIPLKTKWFNLFKSSAKTSELRRYGPRWNEKTCPVGRAVTLSKGYGKHERLSGRVTAFHKRHGQTFGSTYRVAIRETFGTDNITVAEIRIALESSVCETKGGDT